MITNQKKMVVATFMIRIPTGYSDSGYHVQHIEVQDRENALEEVRSAVRAMNEAILVRASVHIFET